MFSIFKKNVPACPYCEEELEGYTFRSKKCPYCKEKIIVITDLENDEKILLKSDQIKPLELKNMYFKHIQFYFTKKELVRRRDQWFNKMPQSSYGDLIHSTYNELLFNKVNNRAYSSLSSIYMHLALFHEYEGKPYVQIMKESYKHHILGMRGDLDIKIAMSFHPDCCTECKKIDGKFYTFKEALKNIPWPPDACTCNHRELFGSTFIYNTDLEAI